MKRIAMMLAGGLLLCLGALAAADENKNAEAAAGLASDQIARLEGGKVVLFKKGSKDAQGNLRGQGRAMALVDKPYEDVWKQLRDHDKWPEFMPHLVKIETYFEKDNEAGVQETLSIGWSKVRYHVIHTYTHDEKAATLAWRLDRGKKNDINDTTGAWTVKPYGKDRCLIEYSVSVDSGMAVPGFIENFLFNQDLPGVVKALKKRAESDGTYKK